MHYFKLLNVLTFGSHLCFFKEKKAFLHNTQKLLFEGFLFFIVKALPVRSRKARVMPNYFRINLVLLMDNSMIS